MKRWRVHIREPHDVSVMRPGPWGNPFSSKAHAASQFRVNCRAQALAYFQSWVVGQPDLIKKAKSELYHKVLACCCGDYELCHGDIWVAVIYDLPLPLQTKEPDTSPTLF